MSARRLGWLGAGLVALGLVLMLVASVVPGNGVFGPGWMMGRGMMGPEMMNWGPAPSAPPGTSVRMAGSRFDPATLSVTAGETVRWFNDDALPHTVTAADGSWDSGNLPPGASFERRFDAAGTYQYLCRYHPGMIGTIAVTTP